MPEKIVSDSKERVALELMYHISQKDSNGYYSNKNDILNLYAECLQTVFGIPVQTKPQK